MNNVDVDHKRLHKLQSPLLPKLPTPEVSVVLTAHNDAQDLAYLLHAFNCQEWAPAFEVIVCDDGSNDDTLAVVRSQPWKFECRYYWKPHRGFHFCHALNSGLALAKGWLTIICDAGTMPFSTFIAEHVKRAQPGQLVSGMTIQVDDEAIYQHVPEALPPSAMALLVKEHTARDDSKMANFIPEETYTVARLAVDPNIVGICCTTNLSGYTEEMREVGFNEDFETYGLQDYEFGYRWLHAGKVIKWSPTACNMNIGKAACRLIHPDSVAVYSGVTGQRINPAAIEGASDGQG